MRSQASQFEDSVQGRLSIKYMNKTRKDILI